ncbi:hypothetical protein ACFWIQ_23945 [Kitasatospora sp. NPDC127059]|uniref:hypothetical protein n=1 Tax=unclassified Kitasatospora TaxID=2633591 RepID=UPI003658F841
MAHRRRARHPAHPLFLKLKLAFQRGDLDSAGELIQQVRAGLQLLSHRDQIRFEVLSEILAIRTGDRSAAARLKQFAERVQAENAPDLAAEVWRMVAENALGS